MCASVRSRTDDVARVQGDRHRAHGGRAVGHRDDELRPAGLDREHARHLLDRGANGRRIAVEPSDDDVGPDRPLEVRRCSLGDEAADVDDADPVGEHVGLLEVLRREEDRHPQLDVEPANLLPHRGAADRVEAGRGLVEEQDLRVVDERRGEVEPAPHAARVRADSAIEGVTDVDQLGQLGDAAVGVASGQAVEQPLQPQQLGAGLARIERRLLERDADAQPNGSRVGGDVEPGDRRRAARRSDQRAQHLHRGRLAGAVGAEEPVDLAGGDVEVDPVDRGHLAVLTYERCRSNRGTHVRFPCGFGPVPVRCRPYCEVGRRHLVSSGGRIIMRTVERSVGTLGRSLSKGSDVATLCNSSL